MTQGQLLPLLLQTVCAYGTPMIAHFDGTGCEACAADVERGCQAFDAAVARGEYDARGNRTAQPRKARA